MNNNIAILIPIYKTEISTSELISLKQCKKILGEFPIVFIHPKDLELKNYTDVITKYESYSFDNKYFNNIKGYSQLMLSPFFYKSFLSFQYILIYQLDAFVFKNDLEFWANKNYDYIGAPWLSKPPLTNGKPFFDLTPWFVNKVGNGGLSLRKVKSHYRNTIFFRPLLLYFVKNEDMFWGLFIDWLNPFFKKPKVAEALFFAFEMNPRKSFELTNNQLPFGVHAWEKYDKEFWKKWI
jgi:Protein of unknown function (DUF5672)